MSFDARKFASSPRDHLGTLQYAKKAELLSLAADNNITVPSGLVKKEILGMIVNSLVNKGFITEEEAKPVRPLTLVKASPDPEIEKLKLMLELEKAKIASEQARAQTEQVKAQAEQAKAQAERERIAHLEIENKSKLELEKELSEIRLREKAEEQRIPEVFNLVKARKLVPIFDEREPDNFFSTFENTAQSLKWPKAEWVLLIRNSFKGKAASVSAQMVSERDYEVLKKSILDAYSITAEGYRQIFRNSSKGVSQTFLEFFTLKSKQFLKWIEKDNVTSLSDLKNLILLEEFLRKIPTNISMYIREKQEKDPKKAALLADEYFLIHKNKRVNQAGNYKEYGHKDYSYSYSEHCSFCKVEGHSIQNCPKPQCRVAQASSFNQQRFQHSQKPSTQQKQPSQYSSQHESSSKVGGTKKAMHCARSEREFDTFKCRGRVGEHPITLLRDTGSSQTMISHKLKHLAEETNRYVTISDLSCQTVLPIVTINLDCPYYTGVAEVAILNKDFPCEDIDVLIGNDLAQGKVLTNLIVLSPENVKDQQCQVVTRSMAGNKNKISDAPPSDDSTIQGRDSVNNASKLLNINPNSFADMQQKDESLSGLFKRVQEQPDVNQKCPYFYLDNGILLRHFRSPKLSHQDTWGDHHQLVMPEQYRKTLLELAHSTDSHLGITKTYQRLAEDFYWLGMKKDVKSFVSTCPSCQLVGKPNQKIPPAPLIPITVPKTPFEKVIIDCVGPFNKTRKGNEYLLTILCPTTRFPIAIPVRNISAKTLISHMLHIFTIFGFPRELQCDRGTNFTSKVFTQTLHSFNIHHILASAYHPQTNGALERTHQTIKSLLRKYILETGREWDEDLDLLMYVLRSVPNESTNISAFELMFGRRPRTILSTIKERILQSTDSEEFNASAHLDSLKEKLEHLYTFAHKNLKQTQDHMKHLYDKKTKVREFKVGDEVLLYHPIPGAPLKEKFMGPYVVEKRTSKVNYIIKTPDRRKSSQLVHVNLLKPYLKPRTSLMCKVSKSQSESKPCNAANEADLFSDMINDSDLIAEEALTDEIVMSWKDSSNSSILQSLPQYLHHLVCSHNKQLSSLIHQYEDICSDVPGRCTLGKHDVVLKSDVQPIRQPYYRMSHHKLAILKEEIDYLLENNLATPSSSPWASPCLLVEKPNGKYRMCTDYRKVNSVTLKDSYPLPRILDIIDNVSSSNFLTQLDLMKGYYQIELTDRAKDISSFITPFGLYSYKVLPFGMCNGPATFQRIMQTVIHGLQGVYVYLDDIVVATNTWNKHLERLEEVFQRIQAANLTINLSKSTFGKGTVKYLGHEIGSGKVLPKDSNVQCILKYPTPHDKKSLRTFLGMTGYYARFCPNYSTITGPLFELTTSKTKFTWTDEHNRIFNQLQVFMSSAPILKAPNFQKSFYLQVDASNKGFGGVLLQNIHTDGSSSPPPLEHLFPIAYHSGRFTGPQLRWPTIEKELYSIVASLLHFKPYLDGQEETIVFSDHLPLCFLERAKLNNLKLLRWSYILSSANIRVLRIPGSRNTLADAMSRMGC